MQSDQFASEQVKGQARETTLSQFVPSEDKSTTSITRKPECERIKGLSLPSSTAKVVCKTTQRKHECSHTSGPVLAQAHPCVLKGVL